MVCKKCGANNKDGVKFCRVCGSELSSLTNQHVHNKKINLVKIVAIIISVVVTVGVGFALFVLICNSNNSNRQNDAEKEEIAAINGLNTESQANTTNESLSRTESTTVPLTTQIPSTVKYYTVKFINYDGSVISQQMVEEGHSAEAPEPPIKPSDDWCDYTFKGWGLDYSNVTTDMIIAPEFEIQSKY